MNMNKIVEFVKGNWTFILGGVIGGVGGYIYWLKVGCSTGTCPITSTPLMSTIWGAVLGALLFSMFQPKRKQAKE